MGGIPGIPGSLGDVIQAGKAIKGAYDDSKDARNQGNKAGGADAKFGAVSLEDGSIVQAAKQGTITANVDEDKKHNVNAVTVFKDKDSDGVNDVKVKATRGQGQNNDLLEYTDIKTGKVTGKANSALAGALLDAGFTLDGKLDAREASQASHLVDASEPPPAPAATPAGKPAAPAPKKAR